jgi:hypothetical protein
MAALAFIGVRERLVHRHGRFAVLLRKEAIAEKV